MVDYILDEDETELLDSYENGEWQQIDNFEAEKAKYIEAAKNTFKKSERINIRLTPHDLHQIKLKAIEDGIGYQTLIASLIHNYITGRLVKINTK